jgi:hypothetical protein
MLYCDRILQFFRDHELFAVFPAVFKYFAEIKRQFDINNSEEIVSSLGNDKILGCNVVEHAEGDIQGNVLDWVKVQC